ncbi:protein of unknown function [Candidatus Nitrosocosmicus franklandus]|uniref:Uncharacterized protein n=1 Tax=Candidatus Nitrosocosmicus franklandianus TaxID=1798806 RepID=A0A484I6G0_9ARCH|nr:protein of unknown function [Candidatus Nitrosocosmicus franklandus]
MSRDNFLFLVDFVVIVFHDIFFDKYRNLLEIFKNLLLYESYATGQSFLQNSKLYPLPRKSSSILIIQSIKW